MLLAEYSSALVHAGQEAGDRSPQEKAPASLSGPGTSAEKRCLAGVHALNAVCRLLAQRRRLPSLSQELRRIQRVSSI